MARFIILLASVWCLTNAHAHTVRPSVVTIVPEGNPPETLEITVRASLEYLLADIGPEYTDTNDSPNAELYDALRALEPDALRARFEEFRPEFLSRVQLFADGEPAVLEVRGVDVPPVGDIEWARDATLRLRGVLPPGTRSFEWRWPGDYGSHVLRILGGEGRDVYSVWLQPGETAEPYRLGEAAGAASAWSLIGNYIVIGFEHIVPKGLDHILFVLGLFLLSLRLAPLLWQVTAFTLAHTLTLGLSIYGVVALSPSIVEPLIALSIAYVGIENCFVQRLQPWRVALVFAFGLLHGLGFAGVLSEIGLPEGQFLTALLAFNVGVELGQLAVILGAFLVLGWFRHRPWYRSFVTVPLSLVIAMTGLYWAVERTFS